MQKFLEREWKELVRRTTQSADHWTCQSQSENQSFPEEAASIATQEPPQRYEELLDRYRSAAELAVRWQEIVKGGRDS